MVLNSLMHELDSNHYSPIYVRGNNLTEVELHKTILNSLDHQPPYQSGAAKRLFYRVVSELSKQPVVFIDDAQEMHDTALLALKSMANFDSDSPHKITFVLCGQPELTAALKLSRYLALKQRIRLFFHMQGMSLQETCAYIDHHTTAAGKPTSIFADDAKSDVYRCSGGIPHRVNLICYRSIVNAALNEITIIDSERYIGTGCGECPVKEKCTKGKQRSLYIDLREGYREKMREKLNSDKGREIYMKRQGLVEPLHGDDQKNKGWKQHHLRGLEKARGEFILVRIATNLAKIIKYKSDEVFMWYSEWYPTGSFRIK